MLESPQYTQLQKQFQLQQSVVSALQKPYITENETNQLNAIKDMINRFCQGVRLVSFPPSNEQVTRVVFSEIVDLLGHFKVLSNKRCSLGLQRALRAALRHERHEDAQLGALPEHQRETVTPLSRLESVRFYSGELLVYTIQLLKELKLQAMTQEYLEILLFAVENTQFKNLIVDQVEQMYLVLKNYIAQTMADEVMCQSMTEIFTRFLSFHFENQNTKYDKLSQLFVQIIDCVSDSQNDSCQANLEQIFEWCIKEAYENNIDQVKFIIQEVIYSSRSMKT
jgi:hypothetical protein